MARYTPEQQRTIRRIKRSPAYKAASPRERKSVLLAAAVESNFRDLPYGDRDSEGALQQRPSQGWGPAAESLETDVAQYLSRARQANTQGGSAGQLAARVQRPAKEYEGRYDERSAEVDALLGGGGRGRGGTRYSGGSQPTTTTKTIPGVDRSADRRKLLALYLLQRRDPDALLSLAQGLRGARDTPDRTETTRTPARARTKAAKPATGGKRYDVLESFYRGPGGVNIDNGKPVGRDFVSGHENHVHVASGPKQIRALAKVAQDRFGLTVRELEGYDPVDPVHTQGSYHYRKQAFDASGDPERMAAFSRWLAQKRKR